jgi:hypothetical protein
MVVFSQQKKYLKINADKAKGDVRSCHLKLAEEFTPEHS